VATMISGGYNNIWWLQQYLVTTTISGDYNNIW